MKYKYRRWVSWWTEDVVRRWLLVGGLIYAWFFGQGIPLWDDDFTSWFWKIKDKSVLRVLLEWLSPLSTQPENWGFNERPLQALTYKLCYWISGYDSWSYMLFKGVAFALVGVMIYQWGLRLAPATRGGRMAALAAAIVFMVMPGPMVAYLWHCDYAPVAEFLFLLMTYLIWDAVEETPETFRGRPRLGDLEHRRWLFKWAGLSLATYLAYKSKADLKLIPAILALYVLIVRRQQVWFFAVPVGLMGLLAIPWGGAIFHKLPPFVPGSGGSPVGWMWQPASFARLRDFLWSSQRYNGWQVFREPTLSLAALLGPFLLGGILIFLGWRFIKRESSVGKLSETPAGRARLFALIWCGAILAAVSVLPAINYPFRVRYGMITMVPSSLLLAWVFGLFADTADRLPRWASVAAVCLLAAQCAINLTRSIESRRRLGRVMVAVDQAYESFARQLPDYRLTRLPDFLPYDYRPGAPESILKKERLGNILELVKGYEPYKTYVLTWEPPLWEQVEVVRSFNGCREGVLFDMIFPSPPEAGVQLLRFIGPDPLYLKGEELRAKGDLAGAQRVHEEFVSKHPLSLAGLFLVGLEAYQQQDWHRAEQVYSTLERYLPDRVPVLYYRAVTLEQLQQYDPAIARLKRILMEGTKDYDVCFHLYWCFRKTGQTALAKEVLSLMKQLFPIKPDYAEAHNNLGNLFFQEGKVSDAIGQYEQVLRIKPGDVEAHCYLALALEQTHRVREAIEHYEQALRVKPDYVPAQNNLAWLLATLAPADGGDPVRAVSLAEQACRLTRDRVASYLDTLAAAYASVGRFTNAVTTAQTAVDLARSTGQTQVVAEIQQHLQLYRSGRAYSPSTEVTSPHAP